MDDVKMTPEEFASLWCYSSEAPLSQAVKERDASIRAEARAEAASLYERQYEELRTWNAERSTQERWWDMIARHKHERDVFILADEPKERNAEKEEEESLQDFLDRMDGDGINNECGSR